MAFNADAIANEFLDGRMGQISPMKLQKLVYYAHAWHLVFTDEPLIEDRIEAWRFGPVIPSLYREFKGFYQSGINRFAREVHPITTDLYEPRIQEQSSSEEQRRRAEKIVRNVWNSLGDLSPIQLSNMTHDENEPWHTIFSKYEGNIPKNVRIPDELIKRCFEKILAESRVA